MPKDLLRRRGGILRAEATEITGKSQYYFPPTVFVSLLQLRGLGVDPAVA